MYLDRQLNAAIRKQRYLGCDYGEKADLTKGYWNSKRKMWVTTHFLEIIKQPYFLKRVKIQRMYGNFFANLIPIISEKCVVNPNFLFGFRYLLLRSAFFVLGGKFLKKPGYPEMRRTYAQ